MTLGFDYGTANCSVAHIVHGNSQTIPLVNRESYISSTLSAPNRESVSEFLYRYMNVMPASEAGKALLSRSINFNRNEGIKLLSDEVRFGRQATDLYLQNPTEYYYVKSPKSFLGVPGLRDVQLAVFEDLVCAMMVNVKQQAEASSNKEFNQVVIGRPVNFHKIGGEKSNQQAQDILLSAATRAGFKDIEFQFEPVAAGLEYESTLTTDQIVLVVDVGGGTTDCSMIEMGPRWFGRADRKESMIAHSGKFVGGNDMDIAIAFKHFMPEFGKDTNRISGRPVPTMQYWDALAINDVEAQRRFYAHNNLSELKRLTTEAAQPEKISRLTRVHEDTLSHRIVQEAEDVKIALGTSTSHAANIDLLDELLSISLSAEQMEEAIVTPLKDITSLVRESVIQSGVQPDAVYITGGSARSPIIREAIKAVLPETPLVSGDFDGSVTSGLARWADICFK